MKLGEKHTQTHTHTNTHTNKQEVEVCDNEDISTRFEWAWKMNGWRERGGQ